MKPYRGIIVAVLHCLIVLSVAGRYALDRQRLPRAWVKTGPVDPNLPIRGRYVSMRLEVDVAAGTPVGWTPAHLSAVNGRLVADPAPSPGSGVSISTLRNGAGLIQEPVAFFLPEHADDPSRRKPGEELWVEVSVPPKGPPRPLRLGVKRDGVLTALDLR